MIALAIAAIDNPKSGRPFLILNALAAVLCAAALAGCGKHVENDQGLAGSVKWREALDATYGAKELSKSAHDCPEYNETVRIREAIPEHMSNENPGSEIVVECLMDNHEWKGLHDVEWIGPFGGATRPWTLKSARAEARLLSGPPPVTVGERTLSVKVYGAAK